ncbi:hypothetical protein [Candidatus Ulvibacter alkanivorans]|uniref:hypothetical protein n=1 Tax=Candidatus Ulvibacter alkanivorans TaxID=2267620 RepID=UPI000DF3FF73|nr:hypothetical protein [Candidatus Ulvibacter alkanivorans]
MQQDHIELKQKRDIGEIITVYFEFFKKNLKNFINIFIRYNGIFLLGFLGVSYLLVTGFVGMMRSTQNFGVVQESSNYNMYLGFGFLGFFLLFVITAILNYSLAASYTIQYQKYGTNEVDKHKVWDLIYNNLGKIILFVIIAILLFVIVFIVGMVISFIPVLGTFAYYGLQLAFMAWMGLSFMAMLYENRDVTGALGEGWNLLFRYFWKSILVNLVVGFLLGILLLVVLMIPGVLIGIYAFHSMETGVDLAESAVATIVWTLATFIFLTLYTFNQSLSQFVNSVLYFSVHEETYNQYTRSKIEQIGAGE